MPALDFADHVPNEIVEVEGRVQTPAIAERRSAQGGVALGKRVAGNRHIGDAAALEHGIADVDRIVLSGDPLDHAISEVRIGIARPGG